MKGLLVITTVTTVLLAIGGLFEHGSFTGAAIVGWFIPVCIAIIDRQERKEKIEKRYARKKKMMQEEKERLIGEIRLQNTRIENAELKFLK